MSAQLTVLVTGATGNQGNAVVDALLERGHRVRALVLEPEDAGALRLAESGAEVVTGNFDDLSSLRVACDGVDSTFLMSTFYEAGPEAEIRQACNVADVAAKCGVGHLIYSSVANLAAGWQIPYYESKSRIEHHISGLAIPWSVIGPTFFMDNLLGEHYLDGLRGGVLRMPIPRDRVVAYTSIADIGRMAAAVIERREAAFGGRYPVAGDELDGETAAGILSRVIGHSISYQSVPLEAFRQVARSAGVCRMFEWISAEGFGVDVASLHREFPGVGWESFEAWARRQPWRRLLAT